MIGIIGAMQIEVDGLCAQMENVRVEHVSGTDYHIGELCGKSVVVARSGVGKVFAAMCAQTMVLKYNASALINTGIAGTLTDKLTTLDTVVSTGVIQHDMDTSPVGDPVGLISGINVIEIYADTLLRQKAVEAVKEASLPVFEGMIATGDQFIATNEQRKRILSYFDCVACEQEGGAVGQVAYVNKIPFVVIRTVSDGANGDSTFDYPTFAKTAASHSSKITVNLIKKL